jgi:hypothetical protein
MSNQKDETMAKEWNEILDTKESHDFLNQKSSDILKKFQSGELLPMDSTPKED